MLSTLQWESENTFIGINCTSTDAILWSAAYKQNMLFYSALLFSRVRLFYTRCVTAPEF